MNTIVPRWEWRSFGQHFGAAEARLAALVPDAVQESDEIYLLSANGRDNVKIRDGLMDIKVLRETNADGLEQWTPVMKAAFPLAAADVARVLAALGLPVISLSQDACTQEVLLAAIVQRGGPLRRVNVHKRRVRYSLGGCTAELSDVVANGKRTRTLAIETADAAAVIAAVREAGLGDYCNTAYPVGLARLLDGVPERYAVIDAGTNSIKFHIAACNKSGRWQTVVDRAVVTRLGEGLAASGQICDAAVDRAVEAISGMLAEAGQYGVRAIAAVGTAGLRIASNGAAVVATIAARTGLQIGIISGEEESRLACLATRSALGLSRGSLAVFDTGGGSSQFTFGHDDAVDERFSVDVGAVRYTEAYQLAGKVNRMLLKRAMKAIAADLSRLEDHAAPDQLVAMGGAVTNIAAVKHALAAYDPAVIQGTVLERAELDRQIECYRLRDAEARRAMVGLQPERASVILAGACIVRCIMDKLGKDSLTVSDRGLRHGVLAERFAAHCQVKVTRPSRARKKAGAVPAETPVVLLSAEDMVRIVQLSRQSSSIELKLSVPAAGHRATIKGLKLDPVEAQPRQAFFFDTPDLALFRAGVVVRVRRIQGGRADTVIKLRPVQPDNLDPALLHSAGFKVELDVMPGGFVCSASFKGVCTNREVLDVSAGEMKLSALFSREQREFYAAHAPKGIRLDALKLLGPVFLLRARHQPKDFDRRITVEMWLYPDGSRILEVSTKCLPEEAFMVGADFKAFLQRCGIPVTLEQEPKTRLALEFFANGH